MWRNPSPTLHAIIVVSNPIRFASRWKLHEQFMARMNKKKAELALNPEGPQLQLHVVECAFGDRPFETGEAVLRLRSQDELWQKEPMINAGVRMLPSNWEYVSWIDNDVEFQRESWVEETIHALQHYHVVQLFGDAIDLGPNDEHLASHKGFVRQYLDGKKIGYGYGPYEAAHPGYAWACTRRAWNTLGGLLDIGILGAGDNHMAFSLIGRGGESAHAEIGPTYMDTILRWQDRAEFFVRRDIGYVKGTLVHHWHGKKKDRRYWDRWKILVKNKFNPLTDIKYDWQGLLQLEEMTPRNHQLRDDIRAYFRARNEDSIDLV